MKKICFLIFVVLLAQAVQASLKQDFDKFFQSYVQSGQINQIKLNVVDYEGIKEQPQLFNQIIVKLKDFNLNQLGSRKKKMAFWINVYNFAAIKMIVDRYPVESITNIGWLLQSVWNIKIIEVANKTYTLGQIEHDILRKMGDPAIHLAISCASVSCPDLRAEAYRADKLKEQFNDQLVEFLANPKKGAYLNKEQNILYLSSIFDWFKEDFKSYGGVMTYLRPYFPPQIKAHLKTTKPDIRYLSYNWSLNNL